MGATDAALHSYTAWAIDDNPPTEADRPTWQACGVSRGTVGRSVVDLRCGRWHNIGMAEGSAPQTQGSDAAQAPPESPAINDESAVAVQSPEPTEPAPETPAESPSPAGNPVALHAPSPSKPRPAEQTTGGWWTLPAMCLGIGLIACSIIVGQVEENRQMAWQKNKLQMDLEYLQKQAATNQEFLDKLKTDANLVERLAQRQMKLVREGAAVLELDGSSNEQTSSAFKLVRTPPPPEVEPYRPSASLLSRLFGDARRRLYASGFGAFLVAMGLVMGGTKSQPRA